MGTHYHDSDDLKLLKDMKELAPAEFKAWVDLDRIVGRKDAKIPRKYRKLIALAVAHVTQCVYMHRSAREGGEEVGSDARRDRRDELPRRGAVRRRRCGARRAGAEALRQELKREASGYERLFRAPIGSECQGWKAGWGARRGATELGRQRDSPSRSNCRFTKESVPRMIVRGNSARSFQISA